MKKGNITKAVVYIILGIGASLASMFGIVSMYFSSTFLPVYVGREYIMGNQIIRYEIYIALGIVVILAARLAAYGMKYLKSRISRRR